MRRFREIFRFLVPGWLQSGDGEKIQTVEGAVLDSFAERCRQTPWLMFPSLAPEDALKYISADRAIPRGLFEPSASFRARLIGWRFPRGHRVRGNALALLEQIAAAIRGLSYITIDKRGTKYTLNGSPVVTRGVTWSWEAAALTPNWARYWVIVQVDQDPPGVWGDAEDDTFWGDGAAQCWGHPNVHPGEVAAVRALVSPGTLGWSPAGRRPVNLVLWFRGQTFPVPTGNWDSWTNRSTDYAYASLDRREY